MDGVVLTVVGDGPDRNLYREKDNVKLLGEIQNFDKFYKYDAFVLISDSEGLPMSALEAASAGLPILLSNVGGCPELIKNNGILVKNTVDDIVNAINNIKLEYGYYQTASQDIKDTFSLFHSKKLYSNLYVDIGK